MDHYNTMVFRHDAVVGLIPKPHKGYPYTYGGLLHAANNVLSTSTDSVELAKARMYREYALFRLAEKIPDYQKLVLNEEVAHELWAAAQLLPGEGIEDGVDRISEILKTHFLPEDYSNREGDE